MIRDDYDDDDDDDDENKKSNWLLHRSTNCCQNSTIRSQLSSHQALLLTADWWWCLLWEKKHERNLYDIWKQQKPSWSDYWSNQLWWRDCCMRSKGRFTSLPCVSRSFLTKFVSCTYIMDHACRDSCMRGSRRCSKGSARVPPIQSCQYFVHPLIIMIRCWWWWEE